MISLLLHTLLVVGAVAAAPTRRGNAEYDVLILGGGVAGIIAAQQLHNAGIDNYLIVEGRDELGGRMHSFKMGNYTLELGCNWVQGTESRKLGVSLPSNSCSL